MKNPTMVEFTNQTRITLIATGHSADGWQDVCHGHETIEDALECKQEQKDFISGKEKHRIAGISFPGDLTKKNFEQRIVKRTYSLVEEVAVEAELVLPYAANSN